MLLHSGPFLRQISCNQVLRYTVQELHHNIFCSVHIRTTFRTRIVICAKTLSSFVDNAFHRVTFVSHLFGFSYICLAMRGLFVGLRIFLGLFTSSTTTEDVRALRIQGLCCAVIRSDDIDAALVDDD